MRLGSGCRGWGYEHFPNLLSSAHVHVAPRLFCLKPSPPEKDLPSRLQSPRKAWAPPCSSRLWFGGDVVGNIAASRRAVPSGSMGRHPGGPFHKGHFSFRF